MNIYLIICICQSDTGCYFQDATANDITTKSFDVQGFPTLYLRSASGKLFQYDGDRTKEDLIDFIKKNKDSPTQKDSKSENPTEPDAANPDLKKDELWGWLNFLLPLYSWKEKN